MKNTHEYINKNMKSQWNGMHRVYINVGRLFYYLELPKRVL